MSDVCLILEGTYPYVTGGVSTCVYQLIKETPKVNYSIIYVGSKKKPGQTYKYPIPENVKLIKEVYLYDYSIEGEIEDIENPFDFNPIEIFHKMMINNNVEIFENIFREMFDRHFRRLDPLEFLQSNVGWDFVEKIYYSYFPKGQGVSFIDFFYHWRFTYYPLFKLLSTDLPKARIYHTLCTGYAGVLGVAAKLLFNKPLITTEHGIYTHEREIEVYQADWIYNTDYDLQARGELGFFKDWWIRMFHFMGTLAYHYSDKITTLHEVNKIKQIHYGANEEKIEIIPNGIDVEKFKNCKVEKRRKEKFTIGLVGRVVSIKDIKTFIKSINYLTKEHLDVCVYILGPDDEEPEYAQECYQLVELLELEDTITFTGRVNIYDYLKDIDLVVLSSISEGQPMVILEAYACAIPVVTTDVGGCRELVEGSVIEDGSIGASGIAVPFGHPKELSQAILTLIQDEKLYHEYSLNAYQRVKKYYQESMYVENYSNLYKSFLRRVL